MGEGQIGVGEGGKWLGLWVTWPGEGGGARSLPLGQSLNPSLTLGGPNSAAQSCTANFGRVALSSPICATAHYPGEGE